MRRELIELKQKHDRIDSELAAARERVGALEAALRTLRDASRKETRAALLPPLSNVNEKIDAALALSAALSKADGLLDALLPPAGETGT